MKTAKPAVQLALKEDIGSGDATTLATIMAERQAKGRFLAKSSGTIAGLEVVELTYSLLQDREAKSSKLGTGQPFQFCPYVEDGETVAAGTVVASASGSAQILLTAERVALNFVQRMSGIATLTRRYVEAVEGTKAVILDTRKTAPGLRVFDKRAVVLGGGMNHRFGLFDMALVKDNHIAAAGGITAAVGGIRGQYECLEIEVEVSDLVQLEEALGLDVDRILLDNMRPEQIGEAVAITAGHTPLEASGGISLENVAAVAATGVDYISVGALTHSVPALDISFELEIVV
ncbi:MAG: carboxylating nicotinate-nucleotide diphosphorylase [Caldilineaceae bacterium SB0668_bin_21]|nr:carboxylating nicotinate-nucleotide diphosphorylase [Caldilineaceae bacterium SB0668_bin_21]MYC23241.1 carboxylating nicotinate-nucleotide diphosphorylase [Caldilineaceae bacterium SB0662_bin_25]